MNIEATRKRGAATFVILNETEQWQKARLQHQKENAAKGTAPREVVKSQAKSRADAFVEQLCMLG